MLPLITRLDGTNGLLFHVEHWNKRNAWEYQVRWPESRVESLREWGEGVMVSEDHALFVLLDPTVAVEVRWRWGWPGGEWEDAALREWGSIECDFQVIVKERRDFREDPVLRVGAMVGSLPAGYDLTLPMRVVEAGEMVGARGKAVHFGIGNVLREAGQFASGNAAFAISNVGPSQVTLLPAAGNIPESLPFLGTLAVRAGRLSESELVAFRDYLKTQPPLPEDG